MNKITVKHFLNKRITPICDYDGKRLYPIYVQITVNRKTTQIRSLWYNEYVSEDECDQILTTSKRQNEVDFIVGVISMHERHMGKRYDISLRQIRCDLECLFRPANDILTAIFFDGICNNPSYNLNIRHLFGIIDITKSFESIYRAFNSIGIDIYELISDVDKQCFFKIISLCRLTDTNINYVLWLHKELPKVDPTVISEDMVNGFNAHLLKNIERIKL